MRFAKKEDFKLMFDRTRVKISLCRPRREFRDTLVQTFLAEEPGTGTGKETTRYTYEVELSPSGHHIELWRPALLNKGLDFTVRVPSLKLNMTRSPWCHVPSHDNLRDMFLSFKNTYPRQYPEILVRLNQTFACEPIDDLNAISHYSAPAIAEGCDAVPADVAVLTAKWLFAEQDLTYWNQSGRARLWTHLDEMDLWN